jgi:hypothetical protein
MKLIAPEPYFSALIAVIHRAILHARLMGLSTEVNANHLADMMDAIHNIPNCVIDWERCNVEALRADLVNLYDNKWSGISNLSMCEVFDRALSCKSG